MPTISALLPIYNAGQYLRATLDSVLAQTFHDFELLACDDGSTDQSLSILREFEEKDGRIRVFSRENRGHVFTLNELIAKARGQFLARVDSDDICRPQRFEKQVAYFHCHPECVAVGSGSLLIDTNGLPIHEVVYERTHEEIDTAHISGVGGLRMCNPTVMMRKSAVMQVGGYSEECRFAEDMDLILRLAEIGKLVNLPEVLVEYRQHPKSMSYAHCERQWEDAGKAVRRALARRGIKRMSEPLQTTIRAENPADMHRKWAWWALSAGNVATARKHAMAAFAKEPFNKESLRVFACAMRGW
jgi:glycosyltransferase involved in cell wall biosynthesis